MTVVIDMDKYRTTSRAENFFSMLLTKAGVSDNLFIGNLPATVNSAWQDMVLIDVLSIKERGGYARGSANIFLYAKATDSYATKPVKRLYDMELALDKAIDSCNDLHYSIEVFTRDQGYDQNRNYYYNVLNVSITVRHI